MNFEEALKTIQKLEIKPKTEVTFICDALHKALAQDLIADHDFPNFFMAENNGYIFKHVQKNKSYKIIDILKPGYLSQKLPAENECVRICAGAMIPNEDLIFINDEDIIAISDKLIKTKTTINKSVKNFKRAEFIKDNELIINKGTYINPKEMSLLSTFGCYEPAIFSAPFVSIFISGSELIEPPFKLVAPLKRNSNGSLINSLVRLIGANSDYNGIVKDDVDLIKESINSSIENSDLIIFSGGSADSESDATLLALKEINAEMIIDSLNLKPGGSTKLFLYKEKPILLLPGSPISAFAAFHLIAKPLIHKLMGSDYRHRFIKSISAKDFTIQKNRKINFVPAKIVNGEIEYIKKPSNSDLRIFQNIDCFIKLDIGKDSILSGEIIDILLV